MSPCAPARCAAAAPGADSADSTPAPAPAPLPHPAPTTPQLDLAGSRLERVPRQRLGKENCAALITPNRTLFFFCAS